MPQPDAFLPCRQPPPTDRQSQSLKLASGRLEIQFLRQAGRWAHCVTVDAIPRWQSVEGDLPRGAGGSACTTADWPASPVLAEVDRVETNIGAALLAVGQIGRSHFSASVRPLETDRLLVEIACRIHRPPGWLGSVYRSLHTAGLSRTAADWLAITPGKLNRPTLPTTVTWAYELTVKGITASAPASCKPLSFQSR